MQRKRKHEDGREDSLDGYEYTDEHIVKMDRRWCKGLLQSQPDRHRWELPFLLVLLLIQTMHHGSILPTSLIHIVLSTTVCSPWRPLLPLTPGGSIGRPQPLRRPNHSSSENCSRDERNSEESKIELENLEAQEAEIAEDNHQNNTVDIIGKYRTAYEAS
jgi:hypothetical protein